MKYLLFILPVFFYLTGISSAANPPCETKDDLSQVKPLTNLVTEANTRCTGVIELIKSSLDGYEIDEQYVKAQIKKFLDDKGDNYTEQQLKDWVASAMADIASKVVEASKTAMEQALELANKEIVRELAKFDPGLKFYASYKYPCTKPEENVWSGISAAPHGANLFKIAPRFGMKFEGGVSALGSASVPIELEISFSLQINHLAPNPVNPSTNTPRLLTIDATPQWSYAISKSFGLTVGIKAGVEVTDGKQLDFPKMSHSFSV